MTFERHIDLMMYLPKHLATVNLPRNAVSNEDDGTQIEANCYVNGAITGRVSAGSSGALSKLTLSAISGS